MWLVLYPFLSFRPLLEVFDKCYYIAVPYEESKRRRRWANSVIVFICCPIFLLWKNIKWLLLSFFSTRQYTVPDPPGLFDGHVWPMYLKHRKEMEDCCLSIGAFAAGSCAWNLPRLLVSCVSGQLVKLVFFWCVAEYLDGLKTKEEIYNQVYEDLQNNLLNRL